MRKPAQVSDTLRFSNSCAHAKSVPSFTHMQKFLSSAEAADRLKVDRSTVNRWAAAGKIAAIRLGSGRIRTYAISEDEVERLVIERQQETAS